MRVAGGGGRGASCRTTPPTRCSREVRLHLEGQGLAAGPHEVVRHGRLPRVRLESRNLLGDERSDGRRELEAVAGPEARDVRLADDRVDVVLVDRVHAREADDLAGRLEAGQAVEEAVEVVLLHVRV